MSDALQPEEHTPDSAPERAVRSLENVQIDDLFRLLIRKKASDLHIAVGLPPVLRVQGKLLQAPYEDFTPEITRRMADQFLNDSQRRTLHTDGELNFNYFFERAHVFRASFFFDRGTIAAAFRLLSQPIPTIASLELPPLVADLSTMPHGLVLLTGHTGSGKLGIIAAMIDHINSSRSEHIVTIEDRINYFHLNKMSVIRQREVGVDTRDVATALESLRFQNVDVVVIETLHDLEKLRTALSLANDGHLVMASLSTVSATSTVDRYIESFPTEEQDNIRLLLSNNLRGVVCSQFVPRADSSGVVLAMEMMLATPEIRQMIRDSKTDEIESVITNSLRLGMRTMDQSLCDLCLAGTITRDAALAWSMNRIDLEELMGVTNAV
jgi:twitching motility protein PilT